MKVLLRSKRTGDYFQGVAAWTSQRSLAFNFRWPERVAKFVVDARLDVAQMEVVVAFDNPSYNISMPVDERFGITGSPPVRCSGRLTQRRNGENSTAPPSSPYIKRSPLPSHRHA